MVKKMSMYEGPRDVYPTIYVSYLCKLFKQKLKGLKTIFSLQTMFEENVLNYKTIIALKLV